MGVERTDRIWKMKRHNKRIVFAGLCRDVAAYLPPVLGNIERIAGSFLDWAAIIIENDSQDQTKSILRQWSAGTNAKARIVELDGLGREFPMKTERLAYARNRCLEEIERSELSAFDYLVVIDMDFPNAVPLRVQSFVEAVSFLEEREDVAGVFANSVPLYYDVWALREKNWCNNDCWAEARAARESIGAEAARQQFVRARQVFVDPEREPIEVDSAFGGLAIYKLPVALKSSYLGSEDGIKICEHVFFNRGIRELGYRLFILPSLLNLSSFEHTCLNETHRPMTLSANGRSAVLVAPGDHQLDKYRKDFPLYDERLPMLAALYSRRRTGSILDIGANIGDGLVLCRLHGCTSRYICVEGHHPYYAVLWANALAHGELFGEHRLIGKFAKAGSAKVSVLGRSGTASLVEADAAGGAIEDDRFSDLPDFDDGTVGLIKLDTDGSDADILLRNYAHLEEQRPIVWAEAETFNEASLSAWRKVTPQLARLYKYVIVFDNFGFAIAAGLLSDLIRPLLFLFEYVYNQRTCNKAAFGGPKIYYLDLVFFSPDDEDLFAEFQSSLPELRASAVGRETRNEGLREIVAASKKT
jgi:FkbM family methyltransferase